MEERCRFVLLAQEPHVNLSALCRDFGVSRKTGYKWLERFWQEGIRGLEERSRRPLHCPREVEGDLVCEIVSIRQAHRRWGGVTIREILHRRYGDVPLPSARTIDRILRRCGLVKARKHHARRVCTGEEIVVPQSPNDVWTVDFKGWWQTQDGRRCVPLTIRDEYSRFLLDVAALDRMDGQTVRKRFIGCFERYGLPKYIRSDNGGPFSSSRGVRGLSRLSVWWIKQGIHPNRIPPGSPQYNGGHERMHRDMKAELQGTPAKDLKLQQEIFDAWRLEFNTVRPHRALKMATPAERYSASPRRYEKEEVPYDYGEGFKTRRVCRNGRIRWRSERRFISNALYHEVIGLEEIEGGMVSLWFRDYYLGTTDIDFCHPLGGGGDG